MRSFFLLFLGVGLFLLQGCDEAKVVNPSFYHWKSSFRLDSTSRNALSELEVKRLYLRFFDIDLAPGGGNVRPVAKVQLNAPPQLDQEIVPCVFLTNRSLKALPMEEMEGLAQNIYTQIQLIRKKNQLPVPKEIQMDCDWTPSTQEKYFSFLSYLKDLCKEANTQLSCTVRLHQYKYPEQTGVPDVDRGMLMVYNVGYLDDPQEENSIFSLETVQSYLTAQAPYPIPLDVALPIFGWGVLIREGKPIRLLNNLRLEEALTDSLLQQTGPHQVEVRQSHYFYGRYLYSGDKIRFESVSPGTLLAGAEMVADALPEQKNRYIALYHLDSLSICQYSYDTLETVYRTFH